MGSMCTYGKIDTKLPHHKEKNKLGQKRAGPKLVISPCIRQEIWLMEPGTPGEIRTPNPLIRSQMAKIIALRRQRTETPENTQETKQLWVFCRCVIHVHLDS